MSGNDGDFFLIIIILKPLHSSYIRGLLPTNSHRVNILVSQGVYAQQIPHDIELKGNLQDRTRISEVKLDRFAGHPGMHIELYLYDKFLIFFYNIFHTFLLNCLINSMIEA